MECYNKNEYISRSVTMKSFFLFSKNVIPSRARNLIAIGWWIWTVFIILIILSPDHVNSLPFNYLTLLSQIILFFGIKNVPTSSTWNGAVMLTGILTFNPILILGFYFANSEYKIYTPKETTQVSIRSTNGRTIRTSSAARKVINVGWWLRWVVIGLGLIVYEICAEFYIQDAYGWQSQQIRQSNANAFLTILFIIFVIPQIIASIGKNKIPQSSGWSVYFMVIGLLTIDPLYFIGGLLARSEINRIETNEMIQQLKSSTISNVVQPRNDMTSEISKLKKLVDQGVLTEDEFSKAKERLIDKI